MLNFLQKATLRFRTFRKLHVWLSYFRRKFSLQHFHLFSVRKCLYFSRFLYFKYHACTYKNLICVLISVLKFKAIVFQRQSIFFVYSCNYVYFINMIWFEKYPNIWFLYSFVALPWEVENTSIQIEFAYIPLDCAIIFLWYNTELQELEEKKVRHAK